MCRQGLQTGDELPQTLWARSLVFMQPMGDVHPDVACSNLLVNEIFFQEAVNILQLDVDATRIEAFRL